MTTSSLLIIVRKHSEYAVAGLLGVVITQALGYGLIFDLNFFLRNLSVMGGLLMVLSDSWVRKKFAPAGLPQLDEKDRKMYFQLAGRVLLIFLFIGFVFAGEWSFGRVLVILVGAVACVMVVVGFKAKWSAVMLVVILSIFNLLVNNFWTVSFSLITAWHGMFADLIRKAASPPPTQRFRQVRLFPDPLNRWRSALAGEHGSWSIQCGREEEGILGLDIAFWNSSALRGPKHAFCALGHADRTAEHFTERPKRADFSLILVNFSTGEEARRGLRYCHGDILLETERHSDYAFYCRFSKKSL